MWQCPASTASRPPVVFARFAILLHVLILTSLNPSNTVERSVEAGAEGFVSKTDAPEDIIRRIVGICEGTPQFNPASQRQLINDLSMQRPPVQA